MGIDRISGSDKPEDSGKPDAQGDPPSLPPDRPGTPGQPSRRESLAAARALQREAAEGQSPGDAKAEQPQEKDDKPTVPAPAEPADDKPRPVAEAGPPETEEADRPQRPGEELRTEDNGTPLDDDTVNDRLGPPDDELEDERPQDGRSELASEGTAAEEAGIEESKPEDSEQDDEDSGPLAEGKDLPADPPDSQAEDLEGEQPEEEASDAATDDDTSDQEEQDEPGSWLGEGGQYLSAFDNRRISEDYENISLKEPEITRNQQAIEKSVSEAKLVGLEYRLKGEDRFKEKVADALQFDFPDDPRGAVENIHDAIRYTYQVPTQSYAQAHAEITRKLTEQGYEMTFSRNSWSNPDYKGINTRWQTQEGQMFEVQFHTPESFAAKQETHEAYEKMRNPLTSSQEKAEIRAYQREISSKITIPDNIGDIT